MMGQGGPAFEARGHQTAYFASAAAIIVQPVSDEEVLLSFHNGSVCHVRQLYELPRPDEQ